MLAIGALTMVVLSVLTGCGLPVPANSDPCQEGPGVWAPNMPQPNGGPQVWAP